MHMHTQGVSNSALPLVMRSTRVIQIFVITYTSLLWHVVKHSQLCLQHHPIFRIESTLLAPFGAALQWQFWHPRTWEQGIWLQCRSYADTLVYLNWIGNPIVIDISLVLPGSRFNSNVCMISVGMVFLLCIGFNELLKVAIRTSCHQTFPRISVHWTWRGIRAMIISGSALTFTRENTVVNMVWSVKACILKLAPWEAQVVLSQITVQYGQNSNVFNSSIVHWHLEAQVVVHSQHFYFCTAM